MPRAVKPSPPEAGRRRHQTRQRARILEWLRETDSHPTAGEVHAALVRELPNLSLGTVYRNLEVLVTERLIDEVHAAGGRVRYDGNPKPHHHFTCEACGAIEDLHLRAPLELARKLRRARGRTARRIRIEFFGLCEACESLASNAEAVR
jgi:Fe2+ or Zn2+ uptake regulation protein